MKISLPTKACRNAKGKWHLPHPTFKLNTVCGRLIHKDHNTEDVVNLLVEDVCRQCLGPCKAEDQKCQA